jgi:phosphatidylglycerol:prolipoprotein diacylglycerol transferase
MPNFPFGLTMGMILSIPMVLTGGALIVWALRTPINPASTPAADPGQADQPLG